MSTFVINDQLSVICFHRENLNGPLFAVREFDTKVIRCRDKGRGKNRGPSEQAIRASIRQAILNLNLRSERANKHEIRLLKSQGIIGKRAPSCSLLNAEDMMTLLTYFDKEDAAEELRKAMQREIDQKSSELMQSKPSDVKSKPHSPLLSQKVLSRHSTLTLSGQKFSRRLESDEILTSQYIKRRKIEQDEDIEEEIAEEDLQEEYEYDEGTDVEYEEEIVSGEEEEKGEIKDSPGKNGLEYLIAAAELSHSQLPVLSPHFLPKNELKTEHFIPDFSSILSPQPLFSPSSRSSSPFSTLSSRSCSPAESLGRAVSPLSEYGDILSPSNHRNRTHDSPLCMESPFLRIQESPVPVESPLRSLSLTPTTPLPVILGEQPLSIPDTPPKFPASFSSLSPSIYAIYDRYHKHTLRPHPVRSNPHPASRLSFQGRLELASSISSLQDENQIHLQVPQDPSPSQ